MKFGLKLWSSNADLLQEASKIIAPDKFQFIELTPIPDTEIQPFKDVDVPYIIHATTERHGFNIADGSKHKFNEGMLENSIQWADELDAEFIILHPGYGSLDTALNFLNKVHDERVLIENMPMVGINDEKMVGFNIDHISKFIEMGFGLCLDLNHTIKASISLRIEYLDFIKELDELKPAMYHVADGHLDNEKDEHLGIGKGEYDLDNIFKCLSGSDNPITLETPRENLQDDLDNLEKIRGFLL